MKSLNEADGDEDKPYLAVFLEKVRKFDSLCCYLYICNVLYLYNVIYEVYTIRISSYVYEVWIYISFLQ